MKKKEYKTGDIIKIDKKEMDVIETFAAEKEQLNLMFDIISKKYHATEKNFWATIGDLYPGIKDFDLHVDWKKKEITLRYKSKEA